eukprot:2234158-Pleurochrysis_carterae.AAC.1
MTRVLREHILSSRSRNDSVVEEVIWCTVLHGCRTRGSFEGLYSKSSENSELPPNIAHLLYLIYDLGRSLFAPVYDADYLLRTRMSRMQIVDDLKDGKCCGHHQFAAVQVHAICIAMVIGRLVI